VTFLNALLTEVIILHITVTTPDAPLATLVQHITDSRKILLLMNIINALAAAVKAIQHMAIAINTQAVKVTITVHIQHITDLMKMMDILILNTTTTSTTKLLNGTTVMTDTTITVRTPITATITVTTPITNTVTATIMAPTKIKTTKITQITTRRTTTTATRTTQRTSTPTLIIRRRKLVP